eukprot:1777665-Rhodomonas_salina.4
MRLPGGVPEAATPLHVRERRRRLHVGYSGRGHQNVPPARAGARPNQLQMPPGPVQSVAETRLISPCAPPAYARATRCPVLT